MKRYRVLVVLLGMLLVIPFMASCDSNEDDKTKEGGQSEAITEIVIGNLTDQTGASATALNVINTALDDAVEYYNEQGFVPDGVRLKVISYDTQYEPSKDITGYELLKNKGADLIITNVPHTPITLQYRVNEDQMILFTTGANYDTVYPPGYIFVPATLPEESP